MICEGARRLLQDRGQGLRVDLHVPIHALWIVGNPRVACRLGFGMRSRPQRSVRCSSFHPFCRQSALPHVIATRPDRPDRGASLNRSAPLHSAPTPFGVGRYASAA
jgi:hypothetical protein